jgi:GTPase-associated system helical domain
MRKERKGGSIVAGFNFADHYKAAGLAPGPQIISLRQEPFDKLRKAMSVDRVITLVRLLFGLPEPEVKHKTWFREAFAETDPSFTMLDNAREAAVLSSCLLSAAFQEQDKGHIEAGLAVLTTATHSRSPLVMPTLVEEARHHLDAVSVEMRTPPAVKVSKIRTPASSEVPKQADELLTAPDWPRTAALFKKVSEEYQSRVLTLAQQTGSVISPLVHYAELLREELEMLWWYVGGWSKLLDKPFGELELAVAAVIAGIDLAELVRTPPGPVAAPAILHRLIWTGRKSKAPSLTLNSVVNTMSEEDIQKLKFADSLKDIMDICPVLTALQKAAKIGQGTAWHTAFRKATALKEDLSFTPLDLAMQVYRETMLTALVDEANSG